MTDTKQTSGEGRPLDGRVRPHAAAMKPCPFCGKTNTLVVTSSAELNSEDEEEFNAWPHSDSFAVMCDASRPNGPGGCGGMGGFFPAAEEAMAAWNKRAPHADLRFAGWFSEIPSAMSYRLWEQGGHDRDTYVNEVALYEA